MRDLLGAADASRLALFMAIVELIGHAETRTPLASPGFQPNPAAYLPAAMNLVLQHIGKNFTRELCEAEVAAINQQSISGFSRAFRRHTGMAFVQYVNSLRIELACQHLSQAELSITDICYEVGFSNVSNFNRQFLAAKGMPPSRFRTLHRGASRLASAA